MKYLGRFLLLALVLTTVLSPCTALATATVRLFKGQTLYLPASTSYVRGDYSFDIKTTIYIHNTDLKHAITLDRMDFYNTSGQLVEKYLPHPLQLKPGAGTYFHVKNPLSGDEGAVAYFIIQWQAQTRVNEPIVRGLMLGGAGTRSFTFETRPRIIQETGD